MDTLKIIELCASLSVPPMLGFVIKFLSNIAKTNAILTTQVGVITTDLDWHKAAIQGLDGRVTKLEEVKRRMR